MRQTPVPVGSKQEGVVLIEALVSILLFSFGVLALVGLQAAMIKNTSESKYRSDAAYIAQQNIGELWIHPSSLPLDGTSASSPVAELPGGEVLVARAGNQYTVTVTWQQHGEARHNYSATATITGNTSIPGI